MTANSKPAVRVAVKIQRVQNENGRATFRATLPLGVLFEKALDPAQLEVERVALEQRYAALVTTLKAKRVEMKSGNVLRYWEFGDAIARFEQEANAGVVFVDNLTAHLARDVNFSTTMIDLCHRFRAHIPDPAQVDPHQSFTNYHRANFDLANVSPIVRRRGRPKRKH